MMFSVSQKYGSKYLLDKNRDD